MDGLDGVGDNPRSILMTGVYQGEMPGCVAKWWAMSETQFITFAVSNQTNLAVKNRFISRKPFDYGSFCLVRDYQA